MPEVIAFLVQHAVVVRRYDLAAVVDVGEDADRAAVADRVARHRGLDAAEALGEGDVLLVRDLATAKHEHGMSGQRLSQPGEGVIVDRRGDIDVFD